MLRDFANGFQAVFLGFKAIFRQDLRKYAALPFAINIICFALIGIFAVHGWDHLVQKLNHYLPGYLHFLDAILWLVFVLIGLIIALYSFTWFANLIAASSNNLLSSRVQLYIGKNLPPAQPGVSAAIKLFFIALLRQLRFIRYSLPRVVGALLLFLIPGLQPFAPILWFVLSAWILALQYFDYPMDNNQISFEAMRAQLSQRRGIALGFGSGILLMTIVPGLNLLAMPTGVCAATILWSRHFDQNT